MKGYQTSLLALGSALLIAILVYGMPFKLAALSTLHGSLYGLFQFAGSLFQRFSCLMSPSKV
ncbi:MAG: L-lactate permease [Saprospiraceae bacterium]|nr:L-lactate permease [Saprospiraceae bacterium]